jgi:hypothetical protein
LRPGSLVAEAARGTPDPTKTGKEEQKKPKRSS